MFSLSSNTQPPPWGPQSITDVADVVSGVVSVSAGASVAAVSQVPAPEFLHLRRPARLVAEGSVARAALASDQNNQTYHPLYRAAD
jgi:hypothetical protein